MRSSKPRANGEVPVYLRIKSAAGRNDISTGISCQEENWSNDFKRISVSVQSFSSNQVLERWEAKAKEAIDALCEEEEYFTVEDIRDYIPGKRKVTGLLEFYKIRREELTYDEDYSPNTLKVYKSTLNHLKAFLKKKYRRSDYPLKRLDYSFISSFSIYLKSTCGCNTNSANKYLKTLKAILNEARKQRLLDFSPFENYQIKAGQYNRTYLTEEEFQKIINVELTDLNLW